ncbi:beta-lactamase domain protein [Methanocaldococcus infernus ME]|uniref:Beta-lactamase domain protein n=1 Tax=Methanocaldococcus infernus (strain DSM 11812 / JCM 15783 / ME) TaxID=573063 RepID=D5VSX3_METIM|nr:MBL fold metallo-hydrolase [Methanocaldococcus infernus]ADG13676.1 beta-lactamase domain protein [Methanocaldococcus infernus ME]
MIAMINGYGYSSNTYVILDKDIIVVDPGSEESFDKLMDELEFITNKVDYIINTHCHYDHSSANYLLEEIFDCPTIIHDNEVNHLKRGDEVTVSWLFGKRLKAPKEIVPLSEVEIDFLKFVHTPGHTYGSISIIYEDKVLTGDTLFSNSVGRWDLPTGNLEELKSSILKLERLIYENNIKEVLPGHGEVGNRKSLEIAKALLGLR